MSHVSSPLDLTERNNQMEFRKAIHETDRIRCHSLIDLVESSHVSEHGPLVDHPVLLLHFLQLRCLLNPHLNSLLPSLYEPSRLVTQELLM